MPVPPPDALRDARVRVFFVGLNRTATRSLTHLFTAAGIPVIHWGGDSPQDNAACIIWRNICLARPVLTGLNQYWAFSDLSFLSDDVHIEGARFYPWLYEEYPDSIYVLNTRDTDAWVASRMAHRRGSYAARAMKVYGMSRSELAAAWRQQHREHDEQVRTFFDGRSARFVDFDIDHTPIADLVAAVSPEFTVSPSDWTRLNATKPDARP